MLDQGFQLCIGVVSYGVLTHGAGRIPCCLAKVAHIVTVLAHPYGRSQELLASPTLEAGPYGLGYSLLRHDER